MVVIIDYGMGNLRSVVKAFHRVNIKASISNNPDIIAKAEKLVLPGVGHFKRGMQHLKELNIIPLLNERVLTNHVPILGICLGMQLFSKHSEEGNTDGLSWFDAETIKFDLDHSTTENLKIPHMGWNSIQVKKNHLTLNGLNADRLLYFVHSYHVVCHKERDILAQTHYGHQFVSAIQKDNIVGVQFHPEKSHKTGLQIIKNFCETI